MLAHIIISSRCVFRIALLLGTILLLKKICFSFITASFATMTSAFIASTSLMVFALSVFLGHRSQIMLITLIKISSISPSLLSFTFFVMS